MADDLGSAVQIISLTAQSVSMTGKVLGAGAKGVMAALSLLAKGSKQLHHQIFETGKQNLKNLNKGAGRTNTTLEKVPITDSSCKAVEHQLRQHGVDFSLVKDAAGQHYIFVKAKDTAILNHALESTIAAAAKSAPIKSNMLERFETLLKSATQKAKEINAARADLGKEHTPKTKMEPIR